MNIDSNTIKAQLNSYKSVIITYYLYQGKFIYGYIAPFNEVCPIKDNNNNNNRKIGEEKLIDKYEKILTIDEFLSVLEEVERHKQFNFTDLQNTQIYDFVNSTSIMKQNLLYPLYTFFLGYIEYKRKDIADIMSVIKLDIELPFYKDVEFLAYRTSLDLDWYAKLGCFDLLLYPTFLECSKPYEFKHVKEGVEITFNPTILQEQYTPKYAVFGDLNNLVPDKQKIFFIDKSPFLFTLSAKIKNFYIELYNNKQQLIYKEEVCYISSIHFGMNISHGVQKLHDRLSRNIKKENPNSSLLAKEDRIDWG